MSEQPASSPGAVPRWDIADRMRKSLRESDLGVYDMAEYLGVDRSTVSTWINGRIEPSRQSMRLWALRTGVPLTWLCHGDLRSCITGTRINVGAPDSGDITAGQEGRRKRGRSDYNMHYKPELLEAA